MNPHWIENVARKMPEDLRPFVTFRHGPAEVCQLSGQLCHRFNVHFLRHNLRRRYRVRSDRVNRLTTFELLEHTGRH